MCVQNQSSSLIYVLLLMFHVPRIGLSIEISDSHQTSIFHLLYFCRWDWKLYNTTFWISEHWLVAVVLLGKDREVLRSTDYCWGDWHIYWTCKSIVLKSCWTLSDFPTFLHLVHMSMSYWLQRQPSIRCPVGQIVALLSIVAQISYVPSENIKVNSLSARIKKGFQES
jgi:hypothetical protein